MPYDIGGWIEILWSGTLEDEQQQWCSVINLDIFCLQADSITNWLFGLAKQPLKDAYFANRGVPQDCSSCIANEIERNNKFIKQYGERNFAHTYALWSEMLEVLEDLKKMPDFTTDLEDLNWKIIGSIVQELSHKFPANWIRFVVWGNW